MTKSPKRTNPLAHLTDSLPVRARIGVVLMVACLALERLRSSPDLAVAAAAFELCRRWFDGERFDPERIEEANANEDGGGLVRASMNARSQSELAAWGVLSSATMYVAFQAYREVGSLPPPMASQLAEDELDEMCRQMETLSPSLIETARKAAEFLGQGHEPSFDQLKARLSRS
jgi:Immunity protein Imm6